MPATVIARSAGQVDQKGEKLVPYFGNQSTGVLADSFWYARLVEDGEGSIPGRAEVVIRNGMNVVDQPANSIAWNPDGPGGSIKYNQDLVVFRNFTTKDADGNVKEASELMFTGKVDDKDEWKQSEQLDELIVSASDARIELRKVRIIGRVIYANQSTLHFQLWPAHFNPGGRPNCIFDTSGRPWFAPYPDYGSDPTNDENPPDPSAKSSSAACYWTLGNIMLYLYNLYGPNAPIPSSLSNDLQYFPFISKVPPWIIWPDTFATGLDSEIQANFNAGIGQNFTAVGSSRKGPDVNLNGMYLAGEPGKEGVFDLLFGKAGGWTWTIQYGFDLDGSQTGTKGSITNTLQAIPSRYYSSDNAVDLPYLAGGNVPGIKLITGGRVHRSSKDTCTRSLGMGGLVKVESQISTAAGGGLVTSWTGTRYSAFLNDWIAYGGDETAFYTACSKYPEVLAFVQLDTTYNCNAAEFIARPRAKIPRPIWPFLLSFQGGATGARDSISKPYPIRVEVDTVGDGSGWTVALETAVNEVLDNGQINVTTLRELPVAQDARKPGIWRFAAGKSFPITSPSDIVVNPIRFTAAIPLDERLMYAVRIASDQMNLTAAQLQAALPFFDTNSECPDSGEFDPTFSRTSFLELHALYERWIQSNSYPVPQSVSGSTAQNNAHLRDDKTLLQSHVRRDLREKFRLGMDGTSLIVPGGFVTSVKPGTLVRNLLPIGVSTMKPYSLRGVMSRRRYVSDKSIDMNKNETFSNRTELLFR